MLYPNGGKYVNPNLKPYKVCGTLPHALPSCLSSMHTLGRFRLAAIAEPGKAKRFPRPTPKVGLLASSSPAGLVPPARLPGMPAVMVATGATPRGMRPSSPRMPFPRSISSASGLTFLSWCLNPRFLPQLLPTPAFLLPPWTRTLYP